MSRYSHLVNDRPSDGISNRRKFLITSGTLFAGLSLSGLAPASLAYADEQAPGVLSAQPAGKDLFLGDTLRIQTQAQFEDLCNWLMTIDLGSGVAKIPGDKTRWDAMWVNGNLSRVLISGYKITGRQKYLDEALRWLDYLASRQQKTVASTGVEAGFWGDHTGPGNIYLADTGTAQTAMALGYKLAGHERQESYLAAMDNFTRFLKFGSREDPQGKGRGATSSWLIEEGKDKGALGCGYYQGHISTAPYIISTAITRIEFLSVFQSINHDSNLTTVVQDAIRWILAQQLPSGEFPYMIDGQDPRQQHWPLDTMSYVSEGLIAGYLYQEDPDLRRDIAKALKTSVEWLLQTQNQNGSWGEMASKDQQRSPGCITLLAWYYRTVEADPKIAASVQKYCQFLLDPVNQSAYEYKRLLTTTGFVGLALANLLKPNVTFL
jgi:hypothetical protein